MPKTFTICKEGLDVMEKIFKHQDANHKMIDGWKYNWLKTEIERAETVLSNIEDAFLALDRLRSVGIGLFEVEDYLYKARRTARAILDNAEMKFSNHVKVYSNPE